MYIFSGLLWWSRGDLSDCPGVNDVVLVSMGELNKGQDAVDNCV